MTKAILSELVNNDTRKNKQHPITRYAQIKVLFKQTSLAWSLAF